MLEPRSVLASIVWLKRPGRRRPPFDGFRVHPVDWEDLGVMDGDVLEVHPVGVAGAAPLHGTVTGDEIRLSGAPPREADYVRIVVGTRSENP